MHNKIEIERRFLIQNNDWREHISQTQVLNQGYLSVEKERTIRVRIIEQQAWITIKGYLSELSRSEFEYEIPLSDAHTMINTMCLFKIKKYRHFVPYKGFLFEIDEFLDENAPLIIAELELPSEQSSYPKPNWLGKEITTDGRFTNAYLSKHAYQYWENK